MPNGYKHFSDKIRPLNSVNKFTLKDFEILKIDLVKSLVQAIDEDIPFGNRRFGFCSQYSRFPFGFPVKDMVSATVKKCPSNLFSVLECHQMRI